MSPVPHAVLAGFAVSAVMLTAGVFSAAPAAAPPSSHIVFDGTVTLGNLLTLAGLLIALIAGYSRIMARISIIESRVHDLWDDYKDTRRRRAGKTDA